MDNYKIKVKDEAESKEAQELFFELGYKIECFVPARFPRWLATTNHGEDYWYSTGFDLVSELGGFQELTLPQLRDLVVLKRNDVKDANRQAERGGEYFITSDGDIYFWVGKWVPSTLGSTEPLTAIETNQPQDPALISGAEALRALADGKEVEWQDGNGVWWLLGVGWAWNEIINGLNGINAFRLKPQTIKLELELPKPFEPKDGEEYYLINPFQEDGYDSYVFDSDNCDHIYTQFGAYRTKEEIKQVVEQLRKIRGTNS